MEECKAKNISCDLITMYLVPELKFILLETISCLYMLKGRRIIGNYAREDLIISFCFVYTSLSCLDK
jgi:hypothetical protein